MTPMHPDFQSSLACGGSVVKSSPRLDYHWKKENLSGQLDWGYLGLLTMVHSWGVVHPP